MSGKKLPRRKLLIDSAQFGVSLTAFQTLLNGFLASSTANAAMSGPFKRFIHLHQYGAPPRWQYDLFLNPMNGPNSLSSPMVTNFYNNPSAARALTASYNLVNYNGTGKFVPYLWSQNLPRHSSGSIKAWSLLENMISIRGVDALSAGHVQAAHLHQAPAIGGRTINSLLADAAQGDPADPAVNVIRTLLLNPSVYLIFKSSAGLAATTANVAQARDVLTPIFSPLKSIENSTLDTRYKNNMGALETEVMLALDAINPMGSKYANGVNDNAIKAKRILHSTVEAFAQLQDEGQDLVDKYSELIRRTLDHSSNPYAGINDRPIGRTLAASDSELLKGTHRHGDGDVLQNLVNGSVDLRSVLMGSNLQGVDEANLKELAGQFAVLEFVIKYNICPSISVGINTFRNILTKFLSASGSGLRANMVHDQHFTGYMPGIYINSMFYMSFTACLLELIRTMGPALFEDTLIYLAGEFGRSAHFSGRGSDHASGAANVSLISGRVNQFKIIGNIYKDSAGANLPAIPLKYQGNWGQGAPIHNHPQLGMIPLSIVQLGGSVMKLLGLADAAIPNVVDKQNFIFPNVGNMNNVAAMFNGPPLNVPNASKSGNPNDGIDT